MYNHEVSIIYNETNLLMLIIIFINRKPAKYVDPLTCLPYHDIQSFKLIREAYYQQLEAHGDKNDAILSKWMKWYTKNKEKNKLKLNRNVLKKPSS